MPYFQNELAIGTGDSLINKKLSYSPGSLAGIGGTYADDADKDKSSWGSPLTRIDNSYYEFSNKYLYFSFIVNTSGSTEFMAPTNLKFYINGVHLSDISFGSYAFASRAKTGKMGDTRVLIRINVPTELVYRFSPIISVGCSVDYSAYASKNLSKTWNFNDKELTIYSTYYWIKDPADNIFDDDNWYLTNANSAYAKDPNNQYYSTQFRAPKTYGGKITLNAVKNSITNNRYFTLKSGGTVRVKVNPSYFLNSDPKSRYRMPSHIILYNSDNTSLTWPTGYDYTNDIVNTSEYKELDISYNYLTNFRNISYAKAYFGGNINNIVDIDITNETFENCDLISNFGLKLNNPSGITNEFQQIIDIGQTKKIELKSSLSGSLSKASNCPYNFIDTKEAVLINSINNNSKVTDVSITSGGILSVERSYECSDKNGSFTIEDTDLKTGSYKLECTVFNTLSGQNEKKIFEVEQLSVKKGTTKKYVAFRNMNYSFHDRSLNYQIPGDILMPSEKLKFSTNNNFASYDFQVYSLEDGKIVSSIDKVYPIFNDKSAKDKNHDPIEDGETYSYEDIRNISNSSNSNTTPITMKYEFYTDKKLENVYQQQDYFTLGRNHSVNYSISKTSRTFIKYFFTDCGGDEYSDITTNELIEQRKRSNDPRYFNLSREPEKIINTSNGQYEFLIKEWLQLNFKYQENGQNKNLLFEIPISNDMLNDALDLLRERATNTIDFNMFLQGHSDYSYLLKLFESTPIILEIKLLYVYDSKMEIGNKYLPENQYNVLLSFSTDEIIFSHRLSPFGIRKRGVIINPNEKDDLDPTSGKKNTFIINVRDVERTSDNSEWEPENGIRIVFHTDAKHEDNTPMTLPVFEVFLDSEGEICFSNGSKTIKPFG